MDKISIVKRRLANQPACTGDTVSGSEQQDSRSHAVAGHPSHTDKDNKTPITDRADSLKSGEQVIHIQLSPDQCKVIESHERAQQLFNQKIVGANLRFAESGDGQIVFNFQFKQVAGPHMLTSNNVCEMLRISKSTLRKLVRSGEIKSYKIGKLRRYSLNNILEYLSNQEGIY